MSINEKVGIIGSSLSDIKDAIIAKGVTPQGNITTYATAIGDIQVGPDPVLEELTITPTTTTRTILPSSGVDGFDKVEIEAVTAGIDSNIQAHNIKQGVEILGVVGDYAPANYGITREVSAQGVYQMPAQSFSFSLPSNATDLGYYAMFCAFFSCPGLTSVDLSSLTTVSGSNAMYEAFCVCPNLTSVDLSSLATVSGASAMYEAFDTCGGLTSVDLSSLTTVSGTYAMREAFDGCTSLTSVNLPTLTIISGGGAMSSAFRGCSSLTSVDLSSLTTVSGNDAMNNALTGCGGLTSVDLSSLTTVSGSYSMAFTFQNCISLTSLSFPSLNSNSFGSYTDQFTNMLLGVTGCTVHFPSNLQSIIGSWSDVTAGFGGTNTVILFDLPATS